MAKYEDKKGLIEVGEIEIVKENIKNLLLDNQNPRLPLFLHKGSEKQILSWMLANGSLLELMISITQNGYFDGEPLMVIPSNNNAGKYIVVEGNRRLSAVKILNNPKSVTEKENSIAKIINEAKELPPVELPVLKFNSESEILDYLGYRHITGVKQWNPLAKARYLDKLFKAKKEIQNWDERYSLIANIIGSKGNYVKRMHTAFRVYERVENKQFLMYLVFLKLQLNSVILMMH